MGYYTRVSGEIKIEPVLTWAEIKGSRFLADDGEVCALLRVQEEQRDSEGGVMIVRWADAIVPVSDESGKYYDIDQHVQEIVNAAGARHTFTGYLAGEGEDNLDVWRLYVRAGRVVRVKPAIVWPEGDQ